MSRVAEPVGLCLAGQRRSYTSPRPLVLRVLERAETDPGAAAALLDGADRVWLAADRHSPLGLEVLADVVYCHSSLGSLQKAQEWAHRACRATLDSPAARSTVSTYELTRLSEILGMAGLTGNGRGHFLYALALVNLACSGTLVYRDPAILAEPLGTEDTRAVLENTLLDDQGLPRLALAKVLAAACRQAGELLPWRSLLEERIEASEGDSRALWLAVKGYTETLVTEPPNAYRCHPWLKEALEIVGSEAVRLAVAEEFVEFYRGLGRPGLAAEFLEGLQPQLGQEAAAKIERLRTELLEEEAARGVAQFQAMARLKKMVMESEKDLEPSLEQ